MLISSSRGATRHFSRFLFATAKNSVYPHIGNLASSRENPPDEYLRYIAPPSNSTATQFRSEKVDEFKDCLSGLSLSSNDVDGIREVRPSLIIAPCDLVVYIIGSK